MRHERVQRGMRLFALYGYLSVGKGAGLAQFLGVDLQPAAEIKSLERHKRVEQVRRPADHAVVFQYHGVVAFRKLFGDVLAQLLAAGNIVLCHGDLAAHQVGVGHQMGVGDLPRERERDQRRGMGVHDAVKVGAQFIDLLMERQFDGGLVGAQNSAVGFYAVDVGAGKAALVYTGGRDPDIAVFVKYRQVSAGSGSHAVLIYAVHYHDQLIGGVHKLKSHALTPLEMRMVFVQRWL